MSTLPTIEEKDTKEEATDPKTGLDFEARVIVYNCSCHTYQQVIDLFCKHIPSMTISKAFELAWCIDHQGSALVYQGQKKIADNIARKLAEGGLRVKVC